MSFGKQKPNSNFKKAQNALVPYNFYSPDGNVTVTPGKKGKGGSISYNPIQSAIEKQTEGLTDEKLFQLIGGMPTELGVNDIYNNPFYGSVYGMGERELSGQRGDQLKEMQNELAARNQLGSSYDALRRKNFDELYQKAYADLGDRSRLSAADAYMQAINARLSGIGTLRNDRNAALQAKYIPLQSAMQYQNTLTPLQQDSADLYNKQGLLQTQQASARAANIGRIMGMFGGNPGAITASFMSDPGYGQGAAQGQQEMMQMLMKAFGGGM